MARSGQNFNSTIMVSDTPEVTAEKISSAFNGQSDLTVYMSSPTTVVITRQVRPSWAPIAAIIGIFFFGLSLLLLLYKETETLTINVTKAENGSRVSISGKSDQAVVAKISGILSNDLKGVSTTSVRICQYCGGKIPAGDQNCQQCGADNGA